MGEVGVLYWGSLGPPRDWASQGFRDVAPTNQAPALVPATKPPVPRSRRSVPSKDPAPQIEIRYSNVPSDRQKSLFEPDRLFSPSHRPSPHPSIPPTRPPYAPGAKTRLPDGTGSQNAGAERLRERLRSSNRCLEEESKGWLAHAQIDAQVLQAETHSKDGRRNGAGAY